MGKSERKEAEFTKTTRELTARRAGFRCSFPSCDRITVGPSAEADKSSCIGIAAHIYAAAAGGPRGSNGLSKEELKSPANAVWLCEDHARRFFVWCLAGKTERERRLVALQWGIGEGSGERLESDEPQAKGWN